MFLIDLLTLVVVFTGAVFIWCMSALMRAETETEQIHMLNRWSDRAATIGSAVGWLWTLGRRRPRPNVLGGLSSNGTLQPTLTQRPYGSPPLT